jgi:DNA (cytosine-5)-methyltransferase 3A
MRDKSNNLMASVPEFYQYKDYRLRRLTPTECARLQTIPEWYKWHPDISDTQKYKMLGNGWTVEVIKHIFSML